MSSLHSIEAMNQLADALDAAGFTTDDVTKMRQYKELAKIKQILLGHAEIKMIEHLIDCDANPFVSNGLEVSDHKRCGQFKGKHASNYACLPVGRVSCFRIQYPCIEIICDYGFE